jgi:transcriptional regulator with XRE-family HTH domain
MTKPNPNVPWDEAEAALLAESPELREEYEAMRPAFLVARELLRIRAEEGLSQNDVAKRMGSSQSVISRLERMETIPNLRTVNDVARALGCELDIRFVRGGEPSPADRVSGAYGDTLAAEEMESLPRLRAEELDVLVAIATGAGGLRTAERDEAATLPAVAALVNRLVDARLQERGLVDAAESTPTR